MVTPIRHAIAAWKIADVEAQEADMALRLAVLKHIEGIGGPPAQSLIERTMAARIRSLASIKMVIAASPNMARLRTL
jgi:hypothetical protein